MLIKVFISVGDKCCETVTCLTFQCHVFMEKRSNKQQTWTVTRQQRGRRC